MRRLQGENDERVSDYDLTVHESDAVEGCLDDFSREVCGILREACDDVFPDEVMEIPSQPPDIQRRKKPSLVPAKQAKTGTKMKFDP